MAIVPRAAIYGPGIYIHRHIKRNHIIYEKNGALFNSTAHASSQIYLQKDREAIIKINGQRKPHYTLGSLTTVILEGQKTVKGEYAQPETAMERSCTVAAPSPTAALSLSW